MSYIRYMMWGCMHIKTRVNQLCIMIWMLFIIVMSSQPGKESASMSGTMMQILTFFLIDVNSKFGSALHFFLRKGAHLFEYFILALLFYNFFKDLVQSKLVYYFPIGFSFIFALFDEIYQTYIPGRVGSIIDIGIDTLGATLAMFTVFVYHHTIKKLDPFLERKTYET